MRVRWGRVVIGLTACAVALSATPRAQAPPAAMSGASQTDAVLDSYVDRALAQHPAIEEARRRHEADLARVPQARALPEPVLGFSQSVQTVETRVGPQFNTLSLSQTLPWFGVRGRREALTRAEAATTAVLVTVRERDVVVGVKEAYYELAYVDDALRTTANDLQLLEQYERLATSRYAAGQGSQAAVVKLQAEITRLLSRREELRGQRRSLAARLNTLMSADPEGPIAEIAPIPVPAGMPDREALVALGRDHRPELQAIEAAEARQDRAVELAELTARPTVTFGASYVNVLGRRDAPGIAMPPPGNGKNAIALSVNLTLPIRDDKYAAAVRQATEAGAAERQRYQDAWLTFEMQVEQQLARLRALQEQSTLFSRALVPQAEEALRSLETNYATGQSTVLELLDAERMLLEVRLVLARQRSDQLIALARLERAVGTAIPGR